LSRDRRFGLHKKRLSAQPGGAGSTAGDRRDRGGSAGVPRGETGLETAVREKIGEPGREDRTRIPAAAGDDGKIINEDSAVRAGENPDGDGPRRDRGGEGELEGLVGRPGL